MGCSWFKFLFFFRIHTPGGAVGHCIRNYVVNDNHINFTANKRALRCVCVCGWQLSITCQWDESHPLERRHIGERQGGGGLLFLPYLSFSFTASLCLLVWCALPPTFYSPYPLLRLTRITLVIELNLDFKRSLPGNRMCSYLFVCHFPGLPLSYHSNAINSFVSTPGRENEFHAECNIQCKHAPMHVPVYLQPCLSKQSEFRSAL